MSYRCYSQVTCLLRDAFKFSALGYCQEESMESGCVLMVDGHADHGHAEELEALAGQGVVFYGHNGPGGDSPPTAFASDGAEYATCDTIISDGLPALELSEDGAVLGREEAERYWRVFKAAQQKLGVAEQEPGC